VRSTPAASSTSSFTSAITAGLNRLTFNRLSQRRDGALSPLLYSPVLRIVPLLLVDAKGLTRVSLLTWRRWVAAGCAEHRGLRSPRSRAPSDATSSPRQVQPNSSSTTQRLSSQLSNLANRSTLQSPRACPPS
jgi:hypothetical protein